MVGSVIGSRAPDVCDRLHLPSLEQTRRSHESGHRIGHFKQTAAMQAGVDGARGDVERAREEFDEVQVEHVQRDRLVGRFLSGTFSQASRSPMIELRGQLGEIRDDAARAMPAVFGKT
jgi:hypothetical protein